MNPHGRFKVMWEQWVGKPGHDGVQLSYIFPTLGFEESLSIYNLLAQRSLNTFQSYQHHVGLAGCNDLHVFNLGCRLCLYCSPPAASRTRSCRHSGPFCVATATAQRICPVQFVILEIAKIKALLWQHQKHNLLRNHITLHNIIFFCWSRWNQNNRKPIQLTRPTKRN